MPADEQQTQVLPEQPPGEPAPVGEPDSPGTRWLKGIASAPSEAAGKQATSEQRPVTTEPETGKPAAEPTATGEPTTGKATEQPPAATAPEVVPTAGKGAVLVAAPAPARDLPAGVDPSDLATAPAASARRSRLRRRLRYLRHVRELLLRDLGGFTYEIHRTAGGTPEEAHRRLASAKANRISALDSEVSAIEARLGEPHAETVLREAGIGGTCPDCGELYASDAHFCSRCGAPLDVNARAQREATIATAAQREASIAAAAQPTPEPQPASVLWAGGPRHTTGHEPEAAEKPAAVTSEWLQPATHDRAVEDDATAEPDAMAESDATAEPDTTAQPDATAEPDTTDASDKPADGPAHEGLTADEPATAAARDEPTTVDEPATADDPATAADAGRDEPAAASGDEASGGDERVADAPPADETATTASADAPGDETAADAPEDARAQERDFEPGPNGRRDDPDRMPSGDPLSYRRGEQAS